MIELPINGEEGSYRVSPSKIVAMGLNYRDHIAESSSVKVQGFSNQLPDEPVLFPKTVNTLIATGEEITIPRFLRQYPFDIRVDYEAELAFFIKKRCKNVPQERAYDYIYGYTCMNDVSERSIQNRDRSGWYRGKSFDTFGPIGPAVTLPDKIGDPQNLAIECRLNGDVVQSSNTSSMIFSIPQIISFISMNFTLEAGDIVMTGTPSGVGPLKEGDIVEVDIENIGTLKNRVRDESLAST